MSVNEIIRERMIACGDKALAQFRDAVHPIYCSTEHGQPDQEGSCILLEINGKRCLMTAAHVIDANRVSSLDVGGHELRLIECEFITSEAPNADNNGVVAALSVVAHIAILANNKVRGQRLRSLPGTGADDGDVGANI